MSSISQMERSSSQMRMLGMRSLPDQPLRRVAIAVRPRRVGHRLGFTLFRRLLRATAQAQHKCTTLPGLGPCPYLAFMRLNNLVNNRKTQTSASLKLGLERLEYLFDHLGTHAGAGVRKRELPL